MRVRARQRCVDCNKDLKKLTSGPGSCAEERRDHADASGGALKVKFESYEKITYTTKDGQTKDKKDFVAAELPYSEFEAKLKEYWPKFILHHNDAKWQDDDFASLMRRLERGCVGAVIDFAENYSHEPRFEHQSKYFSQVQSTIVPVVLMFRVEDLTNISEEEHEKLIALFDWLGLPHVISETHFFISSDMQHDNAFIQKLFDDLIMPYIKANTTATRDVYIRSDGCKAQFKCAANFDWVSRQHAEGCGMYVHWSFFESCHGKCYCDPEGGTLKNAARLHELLSRTHQLKDSLAFYEWARDSSGLQTPKKTLAEKKGRGIYRRFFYWIPSKGVGAVNRSRLPTLKADGTSKLHEFVDIGRPGKVSTRRASCHQCDACWELREEGGPRGDRRRCSYADFVGQTHDLVISKATAPSAGVERTQRADVNRESCERASRAKADSVVCIETHKDEQTFPWVLARVLTTVHDAPAASPPFNAATDALHLEPVRLGEPALRVQLYEGLAPGSSTYTLSDVTVLVPARRVRVVDVELKECRSGAGRAAAANPNLPARRRHRRCCCGRATDAARRQQFKSSDESVHAIRAEMPTADDDWEVEAVVEYRCVYGTEQWLVKWKGYGEERNTWEPEANLLTAEVQAEAAKVREAGLPRTAAGLQKAVVVTLKAVLAARGLDTSGQKVQLVARLLSALQGE